jgi:hypothetical protein
VLGVTLWGARAHLAPEMKHCPPNVRGEFVHHMAQQELWMVVSFSTALLAGCGLLLARGRRLRVALQVAVIGAVFAQGGWLLHGYNPTVPDEFVFPRTEAVAKLQELTGEGRYLLLADNGLPPSTNLAYRLPALQNYDALGVRSYEQMMSAFLEPKTNWRDVQQVKRNAFALFGIEYVLTCGDWVPIGTGLGELQLQFQFKYAPLKLGGGRTATQSFRCERAGLDAIALLAGGLAVKPAGNSDLAVRLVDVADGRTIAERTFSAAEVRGSRFSTYDIALGWNPFAFKRAWIPNWLVMSFPALADSRGRAYRLELSSPAGTETDPLLAWTCDKISRSGFQLQIDGAPDPAMLLFDYSFGRDDWESLGQVGAYTLHRWKRALGPWFAVSNSLRSPAFKHSLLVLKSRAFDPYKSVVLEDESGEPARQVASRMFQELAKHRAADGGAGDAPRQRPPRCSSGAPTPCACASRAPSRVWLVACQAWYPGWKAEVDGEPAPLLRANEAFCAVPIPAGTSIVTLRYEPASLRIGAWIALACVALGAGLWLALSRAWAPR